MLRAEGKKKPSVFPRSLLLGADNTDGSASTIPYYASFCNGQFVRKFPRTGRLMLAAADCLLLQSQWHGASHNAADVHGTLQQQYSCQKCTGKAQQR